MEKIKSAWNESTFGRWHAGLESREQRFVNLGALVLGVMLAYILIWIPATDYRDLAVNNYLREQSQLEWMNRNADEARRRSVASKAAGAGSREGGGNSLLALVANSARQFDIRLQSFQPESNGGVSVSIEKQSFNDVLRWTQDLVKRHNIRINTASIDKDSDPGMINARFSIN